MPKIVVIAAQIIALIALVWQIPACLLHGSSCLLASATNGSFGSANPPTTQPLLQPATPPYPPHTPQYAQPSAYASQYQSQPNNADYPKAYSSASRPMDVGINVPKQAAPVQANTHTYYFDANNQWVGYRNGEPANTAANSTGVNSGQKVNINSATLAELSTLKGIGDRKAQAIIDYRTSHGPFGSIQDLAQVKGIGPKVLAANQDRLTL